MAAKRPTGAYPKSSKKANAKRVFEAGVKSGKIKSTEAGMTGAMVAKVAGKVISKVASKASSASRANARGLKAANKPVSKNNRNVGGPVLTDILKRSEPARANRTRLGNTTKKK